MKNNYAFLEGILRDIFEWPISLCKSDSIDVLELERFENSDQIYSTNSEFIFPYKYFRTEGGDFHFLTLDASEIKPTLFAGIDPIASFILGNLSQLIIVYQTNSKTKRLKLRGVKENIRVFEFPFDFFNDVDEKGLIDLIEEHARVHEDILQQKKPAGSAGFYFSKTFVASSYHFGIITLYYKVISFQYSFFILAI